MYLIFIGILISTWIFCRCKFKVKVLKIYLFLLQKICDLRGWLPGSEKNAETHEVMIKIWEGLRSKADKDNDGQVWTHAIFYKIYEADKNLFVAFQK